MIHDQKTLTCADYTLELKITHKMFDNFIENLEQDEETMQKYNLKKEDMRCSPVLTYVFECHLKSEINRELEYYQCGDDVLMVKCCHFTYDNKEIIDLLKKRGNAITTEYSQIKLSDID